MWIVYILIGFVIGLVLLAWVMRVTLNCLIPDSIDDKFPKVKTPPAPLPDIRVHVVPCMGGWTAYYAGEEADTVPVWPTKKEAVIVGKLMSRNKKCPLYIHKKNGLIQHKINYNGI